MASVDVGSEYSYFGNIMNNNEDIMSDICMKKFNILIGFALGGLWNAWVKDTDQCTELILVHNLFGNDNYYIDTSYNWVKTDTFLRVCSNDTNDKNCIKINDKNFIMIDEFNDSWYLFDITTDDKKNIPSHHWHDLYIAQNNNNVIGIKIICY